MAKQMGLPIHHFVASTNINDVVPHYLETGNFLPRASIKTISNAMDVGNPSNFSRMLSLFGSTWNDMRHQITGYAFNDEQTQSAIIQVFKEYQYIIDPHAAVGFLGIKSYLQHNPGKKGIVLGTAHPSKFKDTIDQALLQNTALHPKLKALEHKISQPIPLSRDYQQLHDYLLDHHVS
jgi:threonine synthase